MRTYTSILTATRLEDVQNIAGNYFEITESSAPVNLEFERSVGSNVSGALVDVPSGSFFKFDFTKVRITSAVPQTVKFIAGAGEAGTRRFSGSVTLASLPPVVATSGGSTATTAGTSSATLIPANPNRKMVWIQNNSASESLYINTNGGASVSPASGIRIGPGATYEMNGCIHVGFITIIATAAATPLSWAEWS
jgi:hypothetical protein